LVLTPVFPVCHGRLGLIPYTGPSRDCLSVSYVTYSLKVSAHGRYVRRGVVTVRKTLPQIGRSVPALRHSGTFGLDTETKQRPLDD